MAASDGSNPDLPGRIDAAYGEVLSAFEEFHRQEHRFLRQEYRDLAHRYDGLVHCARGWRRGLLDLAERRGWPLDSAIAGVAVQDGVLDAYTATARRLDAIYGAVDAAAGAATAAADRPALKVLLCIIGHVDRKRARVEAWIRQVGDIGPAYLISAL